MRRVVLVTCPQMLPSGDSLKLLWTSVVAQGLLENRKGQHNADR